MSEAGDMMKRFGRMEQAAISMLLAGLAAGQEEDIRGVKSLIEVAEPEAVTPWWSYGLWGLLAAALIALVIWWALRRKQVDISPEELACQELAALGRDGDLMAAGDFAAAASGVVRLFIERRFGLAAPKRTTEEFLHEMVEKDVLRDREEALRGFLRGCDRAKFARAELGAGERGELVAKARAFVDGASAERKEVAA